MRKATLGLAEKLGRSTEVAGLSGVVARMETAARHQLWEVLFISGPKREDSWAAQAWMVLAGVLVATCGGAKSTVTATLPGLKREGRRFEIPAMRRVVLCGLPVLWVSASCLFAQPAITTLGVDLSSREESRQFFQTIYARSESVPLGWTGNPVTGNAGDTSLAFKESVRLRINYFRAMAGVPAGVVFDPLFSAKAQQAALMVGANNQVVATPPASWKFYSAAGAEGAANSALLLGATGAEAVLAQMRGEGADSAAVGHRRWLLYPWTRTMGAGDVPAAGGLQAASAIWVRDSASAGGTRPVTRDAYVAWPPPGFVPYAVVFPRWSLSYPGADFATATVTMTRGVVPIAVRLEPVAIGPGENTLVWVDDGLEARQAMTHPRPEADTTYTVTIAGVRGSGVPAEFSYRVTVFDPEVVAAGEGAAAVNGSITPAVGQNNPYNVTKPALAATVDWRSLQFTPFMASFGAEGDLQGVTTVTTGNYAVRDTGSPAVGAAAYRLSHDTAEPQILLLPGFYYSPLGGGGAVSFHSRLRAVTASERARVQVSLDEGRAWRDADVQAGSGDAVEEAYRVRRVALDEFAGRVIQVRFMFTAEGDLPPRSESAAGWYLDEISLPNLRQVNAGESNAVGSGTVFQFAPPEARAYGLQARGVMSGGWPLEWGTVTQVVGVGAGGAGDPGRLTNLAIRTQAGTGAQTLIMGLSIGGSGTGGNKALLIRGVGPSLEGFGVGGYLRDPVVAVLQGSSVLTGNDNWENNAQIATITPQVGAFPLTAADSKDAALVLARSAGSYTVQITGAEGTTGIALAEVYEMPLSGGFAPTTPRLTNVSARTQVGTGGEILIAGFTIGGSTDKTVLIRAIGPSLAVFGVSGVLADPKLELYGSGGGLLLVNDDWVSSSNLRTAAASVGAFALPENSKDAALLVTLQPGSYTVQVSGNVGTTGVGLVEVYEVP